MGGFGSGTRLHKNAVVESCYTLDTVLLRKQRMLIPVTTRNGSFEWPRARGEKSSVTFVMTVRQLEGALRLVYTAAPSDELLDYTVPLVTTPCHLGGVRWWFRCPLSRDGAVCMRRVRKLYFCGRFFGCRQCHNLTYTSRQKSDSRVYALARYGLGGIPDVGGMSVTQMGLALKALEVSKKRLDRLLK